MVAKRKAPALTVKLSADGKVPVKAGVLSGDVTAKLDDSTHQGQVHRRRALRLRGQHRQDQLDRYLGEPVPAQAGAKPRAEAKAAAHRQAGDAPVDLSA
jgi:hypothetical protein